MTFLIKVTICIFDNYYTSPELLEELLYRNTLSCGTVRSNRKGLPIALSKAKLKPGECAFRRKFLDYNTPSPLLALRWCDKRPVYMISTIHTAVEVWTGRKHYRTGDPIYKPKVIVDYIKQMGSVDMADQLMHYYHFLRKSIKWWRKLWIHLLNMLIMNAFILNRKYGHNKLSHSGYREYIAMYLLKKGQSINTDFPTHAEQEIQSMSHQRFIGKHFPEHLPTNGQNKRAKPLSCKVCFVGKSLSKSRNIPQHHKMTSYRCNKCMLPMCIDPCFRKYYEEEDYISAIYGNLKPNQ